MSEVINGYELLAPLSNRDAGFAKWGHARKNGKDYFIKEFLDPCYPMRDAPFDERMKSTMREACDLYEAEKSLLYSQINQVSDGNIVRVQEFFRWNGRYYITTEWLERAEAASRLGGGLLSLPDLHLQGSQEDQVRCCLALSHALMCLHGARIVHADIKPRNIMLVDTEAGGISAKIIDVDSSFFVDSPPEELVGDQLYLAPESVLYMIRGPEDSPVSCAIDVFAMGLVFHQVLTGELPALPDGYNFACEACLDGVPPRVSREIPWRLRQIIEKMIERDATKRLSMEQVHRSLWEYLYGAGSAPAVETDAAPPAYEPPAEPESAPAPDSDADAGVADEERTADADVASGAKAGDAGDAGGSRGSRVFINMGSASGGPDRDAGNSGNSDGDEESDGAFYRPSGL